MRIGLIHPGQMGAAFGEVLVGRGHRVLWCSAGRRLETCDRAAAAGLEDVGTLVDLADRAELVLSICPPHAAVEVARELAGFPGIFVDANAISPATVGTIERVVQRLVDGSIIGSPPARPGDARLYLSGADAGFVAELFSGSIIDAHVLAGDLGAASALKMCFAGWGKGSGAMLLALREAARAAGVEQDLLDLWHSEVPGLADRHAAAERSAVEKGWRWVAEMDEIADFLAASELPAGFHRAAADMYRRFPRPPDDGLG